MADTLTEDIISTNKLLFNNKSLAELIIERQDYFENNTQRAQFDERNKDIIDYARPDLSKYHDKAQVKGEKRGSKMYTSKVTTDLETAADAFVGNVFTPQGWFGLDMKEAWLNQEDIVQGWLEALAMHMNSVYDDSNFYAIMPAITMDAFSVGDGICYIGDDEDAGSTHYEYCEIMGTWFSRDKFYKLTTVHRKRTITAIEAYRRWGKKCSDELVQEAFVNPFSEYVYIHAVYKSDDPLLDGTRFDIDRPYMEFYVLETSNKNTLAYDPNDRFTGILEQKGYFEMPYMDWPYWLKSSEEYGRGPLGLAITTVKRLHADHKTMMVASQRAGAPPLKASHALRGRIDLNPDGITFVKAGMGQDVEPLHRHNSGYPFGIDYLERTEKQIEDVLHLSLFLMASQQTKRINIPELMEQIGEKAAAMAPRLGLLQKLFLLNVHNRTWRIEQRRGRLPEPPRILQQLVDAGRISPVIKVRYKGPLTMAQDQLFMQRRIMGTLSTVGALAQYDPDGVSDVIDAPRAAEHVLDEGGFPQDSIRPEEVRAEREALRMQIQMANAQAQVDNTDSQTVKNISTARKMDAEGEQE